MALLVILSKRASISLADLPLVAYKKTFCCWRCEARLAIEASPKARGNFACGAERGLAAVPWRLRALVACARRPPLTVVLNHMLCDSKKLWVFVGFCGFSGSQKRVAFALPKKRWNAGLRQNDAKQMRLGAKALWGRLENV